MLNKQKLFASRPGKLSDFYQLNSRKIGTGGFGFVCKAKLKGSKQFRAVKKIPKKKICNPVELRNEVDIMLKLDHPNIAKIFQAFQDQKFIYIVMELCSGGQLFDKIIEKAKFSQLEAREAILSVAQALRYCHDQNIVHCDVKPQNILLQTKSEESTLKLIDFGLAKKYNGEEITKKSAAGTSYYLSPEGLEKKFYPKSDVWSMGVILYILLAGVAPFSGEDDSQVFDKIKIGEYSTQPLKNNKISPEAIDLIQRILVKEVAVRLSAVEVLAHPWFSQALTYQPIPVKIETFRKFGSFNTLKKLAITILATQLSGKDITNLTESFKRADSNADGFLSAGEIKACFEQACKQSELDIDFIIGQVDTDSDGNISYNQFIAASLNSSTYMQEQNLRLMFRMLDLDCSGRISTKELMDLLGGTSEQFRLSEIINESDADKDGQISYQQFLALMKK